MSCNNANDPIPGKLVATTFNMLPWLGPGIPLLAQSCSWRTLWQGPHGCRRSGRRSHCHTWSIRKRGPCMLGAEKEREAQKRTKKFNLQSKFLLFYFHLRFF